MQNTEHNSQNQVSRSNAAVQNSGTVGFASVPPVSLKAAETEEQKTEPVQLQKAHQFSAGGEPVAPPKPNNTGLPDNLKSGMESLSGYSLDDVSVHYNSSRPAQLQAHAFAQGTDIHIAPGQEKHLAHEAWHVVQQKQNRVKPTTQLKNVSVNDDAGLEHEADVMGAKASAMPAKFSLNTIQQKPAQMPLQKKTLQKRSPQWKVVQGRWIGLTPSLYMPSENAENILSYYQKSPINAFGAMLSVHDGKGDAAYTDMLTYLSGLPWSEELVGNLNRLIVHTTGDDADYSTNAIFSLIEDGMLDEVIDIEHTEKHNQELTAEQDDSDHGADGAPAEERNIDWNELEPSELMALDQMRDENGVPVLFNIFCHLVDHYKHTYGVNPKTDLLTLYKTWCLGGIYTRSRFKKLMEMSASSGDDTDQILQMARTPNTYSHNTNYTGKSNGFQYKNVIYYRDGGGNIDFTVKPTSILAKFNKAEGMKLKAADIKWKYPQDDSSEVQMNKGMKDKEYGVMAKGKKVKLKSATRTQHFAIADSMYKNKRAGKWTWHHLTPRYKMVLIDMQVHAKHGHNGGVYLWK